MAGMREAISRLWASLRGNAAVGRLEAELAHHLALSEAEGRGDGLDSIAARRRAALKLGGGDAIAERYRDQRGWPWLDDLFRDMRYGLRGLRRSPSPRQRGPSRRILCRTTTSSSIPRWYSKTPASISPRR